VKSSYRLNAPAAKAQWGEGKIQRLEETKVTCSSGSCYNSPIYAFKDKSGKRIVPQVFGVSSNPRGRVVDAKGLEVKKPNAEVAKLMNKWAMTMGIKFHPDYANKGVNAASQLDNEAIKFWMTHATLPKHMLIEELGVIAGTLNSPVGYERGMWGTKDYPTLLYGLRAKYVPSKMQPEVAKNSDVWQLGLNAMLSFPSDYNGNDRNSVGSVKVLREMQKMTILGLAGNAEQKAVASKYFKRRDTKKLAGNLLYCAEYGFGAIAGAAQLPFTKKALVGTGLIDN